MWPQPSARCRAVLSASLRPQRGACVRTAQPAADSRSFAAIV